jgi:hypothetical protein
LPLTKDVKQVKYQLSSAFTQNLALFEAKQLWGVHRNLNLVEYEAMVTRHQNIQLTASCYLGLHTAALELNQQQITSSPDSLLYENLTIQTAF